MIEKLRKINEDILNTSKDESVLNKNRIIKTIMLDDNCFFKMSIEDAYAILRDLGIPESDVKYIYLKVIDISERKDEEWNI